MNFKKVITGSLIGAGMLASPAAFAGFSGNVGAVSKYFFRGVEQGDNAAIQGGLDYSHDEIGLYAGTWASNIGFAGGGASNDSGAEVDLYLGWAKEFGGVGLDIGVLYYWYPEEDETNEDWSTVEYYAGVGYGPLSLTYYYSNELNYIQGTGDGEEAGYLSLGLELPITDSLAFTASYGNFHGDEIEMSGLAGTDDNYSDYSVGLSKSIDGGFGFTFQLIDTDLDDDDPEIVVGFSKEFDL